MVIYSGKYSQVYQRICGFKQSHGDQVLQLDDDVFVSPSCLSLLVESMDSLDENASISPCWYDTNNNRPLHQEKKKTLIMMIYYWVLNGKNSYIPGQVALAGANFGVNPIDMLKKHINVDWQPGGCILHRRKNLILENYYPYKGKAYYEDLMHSFLLRESNVLLVVNIDAICMTHINPRIQLINEIVRDIRARFYFVRLANLSVTRMFTFYVIYIARTILFNLNKK